MGREVRVLGMDFGGQEWKRTTNFRIWSCDLRLELDLDTGGTQVCLDEGVTQKWPLSTYSLGGCYGSRVVHSTSYSHMSGVALLADDVIEQHVSSRPLSHPGIKNPDLYHFRSSAYIH